MSQNLICNKQSELIEFLETKCIDGLPILNEVDWRYINSSTFNLKPNDIKNAFCEVIEKNKPKFPFRNIKKPYELFEKFRIDDLKLNIVDKLPKFKIFEKFNDYKYPFSTSGFLILNCHTEYNDVSDYFQQENRLSCPSYGFDAPTQVWKDKKKLAKYNWTFWRLNTQRITEQEYRELFRMGGYVATQFKPSVAKALYVYFDAENIMDLCCGWGDRLAAFYASPKSKNFFGTDPNDISFEIYKKQCLFYEECLGCKNPKLIEGSNYFECRGIKHVKIYNLPAEDLKNEYCDSIKYDLMFTSPPYFATEVYNKGGKKEELQSWSRYDTYEKWRDGFFIPSLTFALDNLKPDGIISVNIIDSVIKGKRSKICDDLVDIFGKKIPFMGQIGMRLKQRPKKKEIEKNPNFMARWYIENVWCFSNRKVEIKRETSLCNFFE